MKRKLGTKVPDHLFVYGTLRPGHAPAEIADVVATLQPLGKGFIKGTRCDLGDFPAVLRTQRSTGKVQGEVFALPDSPETLARLDEYEEYDPKRPSESLFRRVKTSSHAPGRNPQNLLGLSLQSPYP